MSLKKIVLIGNQNSGKTSLFNVLTGSNQHVGNFPGVTVERKQGKIKKRSHYCLIDLPGIYSLTPYTMEEKVSTQFLLEEKIDAIINIIDATNIERNLYLTMQLLELNIPIIIALNMMDEVTKNGDHINIELLQDILKIKVVPISANKKEGIDEFITQLDQTILINQCHHVDLYDGKMQDLIYSICHVIEYKTNNLPTKFYAIKLIEGDPTYLSSLQLEKNTVDQIQQKIKNFEKNASYDKDIAVVEMRYQAIEQIVRKTVFKSKKETKEQLHSKKIDTILTHKYLGIPIFLGIMFFIFFITFYLLGPFLQDFMEQGIVFIGNKIIAILNQCGVSSWMISLIQDGMISGVGSVLSFLPTIVILFFFLSLLEDSGYMARIAFLMDKALRFIGLSGRSFVPMLMGFGCSVPAILATRTLSSEKDRKLTILLIPFMSCSAKLPIYGMIISAFFPTKAIAVMFLVYGISFLVAIVCALLLKHTLFVGEATPFVIELPAYRLPTIKNVFMNMIEKANDFIKKAFTIIFLASICIWFLQNFNFQFNMVTNANQSILATIGTMLSKIFQPLGFYDWRLSTSLITGLIAKESVVSTLSVLMNVTTPDALHLALQSILTPISALSFLIFTVLYMPCIAAFAAMKRELHSWLQAILMAIFQTGIAYFVAYLVFLVGSLFIS